MNMKSECLFPTELHHPGCVEPEFRFHLHHLRPTNLCQQQQEQPQPQQQHQSIHRSGLLPMKNSAYNLVGSSRTCATRSVTSPSTVTKQIPLSGLNVLHHSSPIEFRQDNATTCGNQTMNSNNTVPIPGTEQSHSSGLFGIDHIYPFQTSSPYPVPSSGVQSKYGATSSALKHLNDSLSDMSSRLVETNVVDATSCSDMNQSSESDGTRKSGVVAKNHVPKCIGISPAHRFETQWTPHMGQTNPHAFIPNPAQKQSACFDALSVQTESIDLPTNQSSRNVLDSEQQRKQHKTQQEQGTGADYPSPATTCRSDLADHFSPVPTSSSDEELRVQLCTLNRTPCPLKPSQSARAEPYRESQETHSGPSNGLEDIASLEVSSETQRAMESSDGGSSPPSSGGSDRLGSAEKVQPILDDLVHGLKFRAQSNSPTSRTQWHRTTHSHTRVTGMPNTRTETHLQQMGPVTTSGCVSLSPESSCLESVVEHPLIQAHSINMLCDEAPSSPDDSDEGMSMARFEHMTNSIQPDRAGVFFCHLCDFTGGSRQEFQDHLRSHYDYKCLKCDYTSRTEGRLKRHMKDFHSEVPPDNFSGKALRPMRPKLQRCKQCDFMTETKDEFWRHLRIHIKADKRLECSLCCFVTEYKHHLEYHMRNHMGSKPYKCPKCNYECVNKSMLNSHMKSHSNVYPYRCANCHYATKYCHSLKLHLAKHDHKPAVVLNADGSLPSYDNTAELMSLRRGSTIRHNSSGGRTHSGGLTVGESLDNVHSVEQVPKQQPQQPLSPQLQTQQQQLQQQQLQSLSYMNTISSLMPLGGQSPLVRPFIPGPTLNGLLPIPGIEQLLTPNAQTIPFPMNTSSLPPFSGFMFPNTPFFDSPSLLPNLFSQPTKPFSLTTTTTAITTAAAVIGTNASDTSTTAVPTSAITQAQFPPTIGPSLMNYSDIIRMNGGDLSVSSHNSSMMAAFLTAVQQNSNQIYPTNPLPPLSSIPSVPIVTQSVESIKAVGSAVEHSLKSKDGYLAVDKQTSSCTEMNNTNGKHEDAAIENMDTSCSPSSREAKRKRAESPRITSSRRYMSQSNNDGALDLSAKIDFTDNNTMLSNRSDGQTKCSTSKEVANEAPKPMIESKTIPGPRSQLTDESMPVGHSLDGMVDTFDYECRFCEIKFRQRALYDIHMGFHSHADPYLCNRCGHQSRNPVDFFIHLGQMAHHA
ncbi:Hunchback [Fasciola gigantica]|uniref:Hunchback n=1 Tax=Fasciola gigantica TaxID=46835 RepID=A0A504YDN2_FASGI|nr:Hunchback [Fasciola gigantica]